MTARIARVATSAPWCADWRQARAVLRGEAALRPVDLPKFDSTWLPATLRRRTTPTIRLALQVARQATADCEIDASALATVFACSGGDTETLDRICTALNVAGRPVSPAQFHNSVHNAPSGYWAIATGSRQPSTSISAFDRSFAAGLLEAIALVSVERHPTLLIAYDEPPPPPIWPFRPIAAPFAVGLLLLPADSSEVGTLIDIELTFDACSETALTDKALEAERVGNPAARALPLLHAVVTDQDARIVLPYTGRARMLVTHHAC